MRILSFPSGESVGSLRRREPDTRIRHYIHRNWARLGDAAGAAQVEDDAELCFTPDVDDLYPGPAGAGQGNPATVTATTR